MSVNWVWIDLEMTGLSPQQHHIIEIATIITDNQLNILAEGPAFVIHQPEHALADLSPWIVKHHGDSGLLDAVRASQVSLAQAEADTLAFIQQYTLAGQSPLCGNSIGTDRMFLQQHMPQLEQHLHYRNIDVSTVKLLLDAWQDDMPVFVKKATHRALDDIRESIAQLRSYQPLMRSS